MTTPAVEMQEITKAFGRNRVLNQVDLTLQKGDIHALVGGNGAGKSTLMKILSGVYQPDEGTIQLGGEPVHFSRPQDAQRHGIATVFQEFSLVPTLDVAQNIFLTREPSAIPGFVNDRECRRRASDVIRELQVDIDPRTPVADLSRGEQQLIEIAKALSQGASLLIMDEPTSSLSKREVEGLFQLLRRLRERGISIIYISHRLEEIFEISDRVTVLRDANLIVTAPTSEMTMEGVIEQIVGRKMEQAFAWKERTVSRVGTPLLEALNVTRRPMVQEASFTLWPGEILGIVGLMGSGRTELARCLFGIDRMERGEVRVQGRRISVNSPEAAIRAGIALIPEDRKRQGLILQHSIRDNVMLTVLDHLLTGWMVNERAATLMVDSCVESLDVRAQSIFDPVELLSGGNQQKVVIAKWLTTKPRILIMDEPTIGVDIGTKAQIVEMIRGLAGEGKGVVVISSELPELLAVSDRILVMRNGSIEQELSRRELEDRAKAAYAGSPGAGTVVEEELVSTEEILHQIVQSR
ncbi:MAG: sugar ABC transporter ATP-binding protein [Chloroflexota bacterium]